MAATSSRPPAARPQTGARLSALLPSQGELPPGWVITGGSGDENDSGSFLQPPPYLPVLARQSCASMRGVDSSALLSSEQASYTQISVTVGRGATTAEGAIGLDGYYPGYAARQFRLIEDLAHHRCGPARFRDELTGAPVVLKPAAVTTVTGLGDQALLIEILQSNGPLPDGSYYPGDTVLAAQVGNYIAVADAPAFPGRARVGETRAVISQLVSKLRRLS